MNNESTLAKVFDTYDVIFKKSADPRVEKWLLFGHPFGYIAIVWIYISLVCVYLPNYMKSRKPYNIHRLIQIYNSYQVIASTGMIYGLISAGWNFKYSLTSMDYSSTPNNLKILNLCWFNFVMKLMDLVETAFFIIRKKQSQVTQLHLYHHVTSLFFGWITPKYIGGGLPTFTMILNNLVHIIMYTYYFLSTFGPKVQQKLTIIKSKLTMIQMLQFWMLAFHIVLASKYAVLNEREYIIGGIYIVNLAINFGFFLNFYVQSYNKPKTE